MDSHVTVDWYPGSIGKQARDTEKLHSQGERWRQTNKEREQRYTTVLHVFGVCSRLRVSFELNETVCTSYTLNSIMEPGCKTN